MGRRQNLGRMAMVKASQAWQVSVSRRMRDNMSVIQRHICDEHHAILHQPAETSCASDAERRVARPVSHAPSRMQRGEGLALSVLYPLFPVRA